MRCARASVAEPCVQEVFRFLRRRLLHLAKAIRGCPINRAFACNTLASAGLREKREFDCESYVFGQRRKEEGAAAGQITPSPLPSDSSPRLRSLINLVINNLVDQET